MLSFFLPHAKCKPRQLGEVQVRRHASELEKNTPLCKPAEQHDSNAANALHSVTCMDYVIFRCVGAEGVSHLCAQGSLEKHNMPGLFPCRQESRGVLCSTVETGWPLLSVAVHLHAFV